MLSVLCLELDGDNRAWVRSFIKFLKLQKSDQSWGRVGRAMIYNILDEIHLTSG